MLPALSGGYAHAFASLPASSCLVSSHLPLIFLLCCPALSAHSLPPPLLPYACYSFALPHPLSSSLLSFTFFFYLPLRLQVLLPHLLCLRVPLFSCHLRVISLRLSRVFDFFRNSPFYRSPFPPLSIFLSPFLSALCSERLSANASACSFALVCFVFALLAAFRFLILKLQLCLPIALSLLHTLTTVLPPSAPAHYFAVEQVYQQEQEKPLRLAKLFIERVREEQRGREGQHRKLISAVLRYSFLFASCIVFSKLYCVSLRFGLNQLRA